MVLDPITTFVVYIVGILVVLTLIAALAELWGAKVERQLRDQARAEARAKRMDGERSSAAEWQ